MLEKDLALTWGSSLNIKISYDREGILLNEDSQLVAPLRSTDDKSRYLKTKS